MKNWQQQQRKQLENVTLENQHFRFGAVNAVTMSTRDSNWAESGKAFNYHYLECEMYQILLRVHPMPSSPLSTFRSQLLSPPKVSDEKYKNLHSHAVVLPCRFWPLSLEQTYNIYITYKKSYISVLTGNTLEGEEHEFTLNGTAKVFQLCHQDTPFSAATVCVGFLLSTSPKSYIKPQHKLVTKSLQVPQPSLIS